MDKRIILVGAGSTSFGPEILSDIFLSDILKGSTIVLHDIDKKKVEMIYDIALKENEIRDNIFNIERSTKRSDAFKMQIL